MFDNAESFNQPLNKWDTSNVTNMYSMFFGARNFNQPLNNWNTSKVENMSLMFLYAKKFNQSLNSWVVNCNTTNCEIFKKAISFDIKSNAKWYWKSNLNEGRETDLNNINDEMFDDIAEKFSNLDVDY